jgi:hypothetical protein
MRPKEDVGHQANLQEVLENQVLPRTFKMLSYISAGPKS